MEQFIGMTLNEMIAAGADIDISEVIGNPDGDKGAICFYNGVAYDLWFNDYSAGHFNEPLTAYENF